MKSKDSLSKSEKGCLKRAKQMATAINNDVLDLKEGMEPSRILPRLRAQMNELAKAIHEFNAYHNARTTE